MNSSLIIHVNIRWAVTLQHCWNMFRRFQDCYLFYKKQWLRTSNAKLKHEVRHANFDRDFRDFTESNVAISKKTFPNLTFLKV